MIKASFAESMIDENNYLILIDAIESRNLLSHVYKIDLFDLIYPQLNSYAKAIRDIVTTIESQTI